MSPLANEEYRKGYRDGDRDAHVSDARTAGGMCHWVRDRGSARSESHEQFHFDNPCPYQAVAAVLLGQPDPRDQPVESAAVPGPVDEAADAGLDALAVEVAAALDAPGEGYQVTRGRLSGGDVRRVLRLAGASLRGQREKEVAELERIGEQAIRERDEAEQWADRLAAALGGAAVGEHSSANNPWANALDLAAERDARVRAEERQRIEAKLRSEKAIADGSQYVMGYNAAIHNAVAWVAAGSAVPVATPGVTLTRDAVDGGWVAEFAPVPGCMSQGETIPDALRQLADAVEEAAVDVAVVPEQRDGQR